MIVEYYFDVTFVVYRYHSKILNVELFLKAYNFVDEVTYSSCKF